MLLRASARQKRFGANDRNVAKISSAQTRAINVHMSEFIAWLP